METEENNQNVNHVMASSGATGSISVLLHPLVVMNISEHWTRVRAQEGKAQQVIGALIGKQKGRSLEIMNSFELVFTVIENVVIDRDYYNTKEEQFKQVFSDMDFLGWYTTGDSPNESDIHVHKQICEINESPVILKLNPFTRNADLPVTMYESVIDLVNGEATMLFVELTYTLATEEAERIGVDHVARMASGDSAESSQVAEQLQAQHNAVKMLANRVRLILEYIRAMERGEVPKSHEVLREAKSLTHRLPVLNSEIFQEEYYTQYNDVLLQTYLASITKACHDLHQFVTKFNILCDRQGIMGRRMRGLFF
ncbi:COP9 signalosome complex subunit 6-like [Daphnia pulicaria]|uniref:COP9 signalosome complex subunit 6 n=2 Tax=Daphnia TaxID=6668 RepID=A0A4Y7MUM0_DAPPU|nr:COP9 signalosome complex subunit 6-like [Daphnia pulicaria]SVE83745.1 EOG090X08T4 [Daphnia pulex]SVE85590.1 EOG090X08T4 [Daphnia pulicaria]